MGTQIFERTHDSPGEIIRMLQRELAETNREGMALTGELEQRVEHQQRQIDWVLHPLPPIWGDPALLRQVWTNLISNALKYTRRRDRARIEIGCLNEPEGQIVFYIKDNGAGFDTSQAQKLFSLF